MWRWCLPAAGWVLSTAWSPETAWGSSIVITEVRSWLAYYNSGESEYTVQPGDRIAQLMVTPVVQADVELVDELDETERGAGGFGSTGK